MRSRERFGERRLGPEVGEEDVESGGVETSMAIVAIVYVLTVRAPILVL